MDLTLNCVTYQNNGTDLQESGDLTVTNILCNEEKVPKETRIATVSQLAMIITVPPDTDTIEFPMDCTLHTLYISVWPSGDRVQIACQEGGLARISRLDNTQLSELPAGYQYASAFDVEILVNGQPLQVVSADGYILASFISRHENPQYGILYWDEIASEWVVLKEYQMNSNGGSVVFPLGPSKPNDLRQILRGVRLVDTTSPSYTEVMVNFTGTLALVQK